MDDSNFDIRYVRLCDFDIPGEKWLNYLQTVETLIRCRINLLSAELTQRAVKVKQ